MHEVGSSRRIGAELEAGQLFRQVPDLVTPGHRGRIVDVDLRDPEAEPTISTEQALDHDQLAVLERGARTIRSEIDAASTEDEIEPVGDHASRAAMIHEAHGLERVTTE